MAADPVTRQAKEEGKNEAAEKGKREEDVPKLEKEHLEKVPKNNQGVGSEHAG